MAYKINNAASRTFTTLKCIYVKKKDVCIIFHKARLYKFLKVFQTEIYIVANLIAVHLLKLNKKYQIRIIKKRIISEYPLFSRLKSMDRVQRGQQFYATLSEVFVVSVNKLLSISFLYFTGLLLAIPSPLEVSLSPPTRIPHKRKSSFGVRGHKNYSSQF